VSLLDPGGAPSISPAIGHCAPHNRRT
jgi:hypothetical protein